MSAMKAFKRKERGGKKVSQRKQREQEQKRALPSVEASDKKEHKNTIGYAETCFKDFSELIFGEVDALIFSDMSYMFFDRDVATLEEDLPWVPISSLYKAENFNHMTERVFMPEVHRQLLFAMCASPRYRNVTMNYYVSRNIRETEEQFSAVCYRLPTGETVVAFRGTDLSAVGWKEDLNMGFLSPVPSQLSAVEYLEAVSKKTNSGLIVVGHSKGGNLATFASVFSEKAVRDRIISVYNCDGPGFPQHILDDGKYAEMEPRLTKIMPEGSIVGALLQDSKKVKHIRSTKVGIYQHNPFTWIIENNSFLECENASGQVRFMDKTLNVWMASLSQEQLKTFVDTLYSLVYAVNAEDITDFGPRALKERDTIIKLIKETDPETASLMRTMIKRLIQISFLSAFKKEDEINNLIGAFD